MPDINDESHVHNAREVRQFRRERTRDTMRELTLDHLLLCTPDNIRYVSDFRSQISQETADHMVCFVDEAAEVDIFGPHVLEPLLNPDPLRPNVRSVRPLNGWTPLMAEPEACVRTLATHARHAGAKRIGHDAINSELLARLREELPDCTFVPVGRALFDVRRIKSPAEIGLMERANANNLIAMQAALTRVRPGASGWEIMAGAVESQQLLGAELITHSICNIRSGPGDLFATGRRARAGEPIYLDLNLHGPGGYASDITRTVFVGEPEPAVFAAYQDLLEIYERVRGEAKAGVKVATLHSLLESGLREKKLAPPPYGLGHGIGLRIMEPPSISPRGMIDHDIELRQGEVIALEPETATEYRGQTMALKVEDCFEVQADGLRPLGRLTSASEAVLDVAH